MCSNQWLSRGESARPTPKSDFRQQKVMLSIFWNSAGVVHFELIPNGETIKAVNYFEQLNRVQQNLIRKHPVLINRKGVIFLQDNARPHSANLTRNKLEELKWEVL